MKVHVKDFFEAARNRSPRIVENRIKLGVDVNQVDRMGHTAMTMALYGKNTPVVELLLKNGYDLAQDGKSLRQAVFGGQTAAVKLLLQHGADPNFYTADMVFPYNPSPLAEAVEKGQMAVVDLLLAHGADATKADGYGKRPWQRAHKEGHQELAEKLRLLEPDEWHDERWLRQRLEQLGVPEELLQIMASDDRKLMLPDCKEVGYIMFNSLADASIIENSEYFPGKTLVDLLFDIDGHEELVMILWYPKRKCLAYYDVDHDHFNTLGSAETFLKSPGKVIDSIWQ
ncbi:ankyrin repeat domain-containing protein [Alterisphingorhabdus coralli]|uniref:Ankyrin repeat domain-containing protein n=1 Tax=Alterisphingorhabdus coralli TaxID=3071408 RepID=A0AA97F4E4_9SPHN|nr:ankyrin repeat domain-containing protein [Parasphingorhabdus sp. SCSIO 66989]WOE73831.1 ankyrin repeat domain-containing protein [Parasphingorhabdus sp. SCSIO 66989]